MPFWSKKKQRSISELTAEYTARSRRRMESTDAILKRLDVVFDQDNPDIAKARDCLVRLQNLAKEQRAEVAPLPELEEHNTLTYRMIDFKVRTVEDVLKTAGANLESIQAEENEMYREWEALQLASHQRFEDNARAWGIEPPDLSDEGLKRRR